MYFIEKLENRRLLEEGFEGFSALLSEYMAEGVSINKLIIEPDGRESDYEIIDVNPAYERIFGISREHAIGCRASELYGLTQDPNLDAYVRTARTGTPERFEAEYPVLGKLLDLTVFSPGPGYFAIVFSDAGERKETEARLELELEEKKVLLREIHHRVKNNLTVVSSLLRLQTEEVETVEDARRALEESRNRVYSMALVHEHLYQTSCFSRVGMRSYIRDVVEEHENHYCGGKHVTFDVSVEDIHLDITLAVPVGIILNELITNSLKHAFLSRETGRITVTLEGTDIGLCRLSVRDDGEGVSEESFPGNLNCLGLNLIRILTHQIRGTLSFHRGFGVDITFPLRNIQDD